MQKPARSMLANLRLVDLVFYAAFLAFFAFALTAGRRGILWAVALSLSAACAVLWFIARAQLGDAFSVGAEAHHLVTHGLYARIRHPIYLFGTMAFLFVVLALQGLPALVIWLVVILIQLARVRREDAVLAAAFGAEYAAYRGSTWF